MHIAKLLDQILGAARAAGCEHPALADCSDGEVVIADLDDSELNFRVRLEKF